MGGWGSNSVETGHAYMATTLKPGLGPSAVQVGCSGKPSTLEGGVLEDQTFQGAGNCMSSSSLHEALSLNK